SAPLSPRSRGVAPRCVQFGALQGGRSPLPTRRSSDLDQMGAGPAVFGPGAPLLANHLVVMEQVGDVPLPARSLHVEARIVSYLRAEEASELQPREKLVCRRLLEDKKSSNPECTSRPTH